MSLYFSDEEGVHKSPGLQPISVKAKPSPSPPPFIPPTAHSVSKEDSLDPASRRQRSRRVHRPSRADQVLLSFMSPNTPDIASKAAVEALNSASQSENESSPEDRKSKKQSRPHDPPDQNAKRADLMSVAQKAMQNVIHVPSEPSDSRSLFHPDYRRASDSRSPLSPELTTRPRNNSDIRALVNGVASVNTADDTTKPSPWYEEQRSPRSPPETTDRRHSESMSSRIRSLSIPQSLSDPDTLPALRPRHSSAVGIPSSDNQPKSLPGFQELSEIADAARTKEGETSPQSYQAQRASISSSSNGGAGQSPTLGRHYSIGSQSQALSPASSYLPSISHHSPSSIQSEISPRDPFRTSISLGPPHRRQSQASDSTQAYGPLLSSSSESFGPSAHASPSDNPHRMSIDGFARPILPPPQPQGQHNPQNMHTMPIIGLPGFKCDHEGCTAPPFQTQYLLNSHANVHSQIRPHYCPVEGCSRAEGGKGFKRKNEMIRHGLVHDSPGYVCPFCPDKEHKYPRPDNLQRHVRGHHVDKDKDDPQLREVLAQRPEGGNRGRRRRVGERLEYR